MFFRNYTKLADLAFLYYFIVKIKTNSVKSLPQIGIVFDYLLILTIFHVQNVLIIFN